jgi:hypothetical protein
MNKLSKLIKRLLVIARAPDTKYLIGLNLQAIQKVKGKPQPGEDPRTFYQALQTEATKGPIFNEQTLKFMDKLDLELTKDEVKWIATRYQKKAKIDPNTLRNVLDYIRAEKPNLSKLSYTKAVQNSIQWHEQFKGKTDSTGEYKTKNVILKLDNGYTWVEVPVEDLKTEGNNMGHCVGGGDYVTKVKAGSIKIYSLRDSSNKPHVTIEIDSKGKVVQVQGKQNKEPVEKYHTYIEQLWNHIDIQHNMHSTKYITDARSLVRLLRYDPDCVHGVAKNPNLPLRYIMELAQSDDPEIRSSLAKNPKLTPAIMNKFAVDNVEDVRCSLAENPDLPEELMRTLIKDGSKARVYLARNPKLPVDLMEELLKAKEFGVRSFLATNVNLPVAFMKVLATDSNDDVRRSLAENPNIPLDVMKALVRDIDGDVRWYIVHNPKLPAGLVSILAKDTEKDIRNAAQKHPNYNK